MQWLLTVLVYFSFITTLLKFVSPDGSENVIKAPPVPSLNIDTSSSMPIIMIIGILVVGMVLLSLYLFLKTPSVIAKTSKKIVHEVAETTVPVVMRIQHAPNTEKNHKKLTFRITIIIKILLVITPVILTFTSQFIEKHTLDFAVAIYASIGLACISIIFFGSQYLVARLLSVKKQDLW